MTSHRYAAPCLCACRDARLPVTPRLCAPPAAAGASASRLLLPRATPAHRCCGAVSAGTCSTRIPLFRRFTRRACAACTAYCPVPLGGVAAPHARRTAAVHLSPHLRLPRGSTHTLPLWLARALLVARNATLCARCALSLAFLVDLDCCALRATCAVRIWISISRTACRALSIHRARHHLAHRRAHTQQRLALA